MPGASRAPEAERVIGVDSRRPQQPLDGVEFVRADITRILVVHFVDTVVHLDVHATLSAAGGGRSAAKDVNVLGTLQLVGACQKVPTLRQLVVKSSTQLYGGGARDPAVFNENSPPWCSSCRCSAGRRGRRGTCSRAGRTRWSCWSAVSWSA